MDEMDQKMEVRLIEFDKNEILRLFKKLKLRNKIALAEQVSAELEKQNEKYEVKIFKAKKKTIDLALQEHKKAIED